MAEHFLVVTITTTLCLVGFTFGLPTLSNLMEDTHSIHECPDPLILADSPLCELDIQESGKLFTTITKAIVCPETGVNKDKIGCIIVKDNVDNDNGGYASIIDGGIGEYFVDIYLESQWGKGIDFHIEVYTVLPASTTTTAAPPPRPLPHTTALRL